MNHASKHIHVHLLGYIPRVTNTDATALVQQNVRQYDFYSLRPVHMWNVGHGICVKERLIFWNICLSTCSFSFYTLYLKAPTWSLIRKQKYPNYETCCCYKWNSCLTYYETLHRRKYKTPQKRCTPICCVLLCSCHIDLTWTHYCCQSIYVVYSSIFVRVDPLAVAQWHDCPVPVM